MITSKPIPGILCVLIWMSIITRSQGAVIDAKQNGAKGDGVTDDSQAITSAWQSACSSPTPSKLLIPAGQYAVGPMTFLGPCKAPITVQFDGNLKAPTDLNKLKSQDGWIVFQQVDAMTLSGGVFDGQGKVAWSQNNCAQTGKCSNLPINIRFNKVTNSMVQGISSVDSKLFHMNILQCQNLTLSHITINAPGDSLNTDGIHIGRSSGITISDSDIKTGDDCVSMGDGSQQVTIERVTCGPGHGISVGSLGKYHDEQPVMGVFVRDCTFTNTMNGVRVKTWPASPNGVCQDLHFENLKMDNVGTPILIDQQYCPYGQCQAQAPSKVKISEVSFKGIHGTSSTKVAIKIACSKGIPCQNVELNDINLQYHGPDGNGVSQCVNVLPTMNGQIFPPACTETP
ncbi:hypothetical protein DCAR_0625219 [Daucus carota subsp. sativus]|uniref:Polygalacturonase n=3 Tax=Daucus carota subsp. sativus TaxID=79200 RepID=A0AAF1B5V9_DAUCS|nr:hypothetical protein DCAR_0625219 [Daucus carota subsp. sativus]